MLRRLGLIAIVACAACSFLIDTDGLDSPGANTKDGGQDSAPNVLADASVGGENDALADAPNVGDARDANVPFCEAHEGALLCDDFDQPDRTQIKSEGWTYIYSNFPIGEPSTAQFFSPPRSARLQWDYEDAGLANRVAATRSFGAPSTATTATASFRVRPELNAPAYLQIFAMQFAGCQTQGRLNEASIVWGDKTDTVGTLSIPYDKWTLVSFTIKGRSDGCDVTVKVGDGANPLKVTKGITALATAPDTASYITIGYAGSDNIGTVFFDDILVVEGE